MILVDIGNTSIHFAKASGRSIKRITLLRDSAATPGRIDRILAAYRDKEIIVCSVVPRITALFLRIARNRSYKLYVVGKNITVPINCLYNKKNVGMDRLVGAYAALNLYPQTRLIIDFGTAVTLDFMSARKEYRGGFILPGIGSSLRVLSQCALLPKQINLDKRRPKRNRKRRISPIPRDTPESISRGLIEGFSAMINSMAAKYSSPKALSKKSSVIVTGGDSKIIMPYFQFSYMHEPHLVLKGLLLLKDYLL
ncbi:MAG: type III pantothenate kinase [Candidatus Omnitrophica bacterium]|nr:type III pantothenate kinase [Candidatus Omnitrophota bacterium]